MNKINWGKYYQPMRIMIYILLIMLFTYAWNLNVLPFIEDDGAFFLKYAVNMSHGYFWKFNIADVQLIWGGHQHHFGQY